MTLVNISMSLCYTISAVGGEFGVGGKFDNGGRFDLRLPYADQVSCCTGVCVAVTNTIIQMLMYSSSTMVCL